MKNNDTERTVDPETLEDGNVLRMLVTQFVNKPCKQYYIAVLRCLRDSFIVIPGNVEISDADTKEFLNAKEGDTLTLHEEIKFVPDILRNGGVLPAGLFQCRSDGRIRKRIQHDETAFF